MNKLILIILVVVTFSSQNITANNTATHLEADSCLSQYPGDLNSDNLVNAEDLVFLNKFLRGYGSPPYILANADVNGDCIIDFNDTEYLDNFLHSGGSPPVDCTCTLPDTCSFQSIAGDVDGDGIFDISDLTMLVDGLYTGGNFPILANADINGDCRISFDDFTLIEYLIYFPDTSEHCTCFSPKLCEGYQPGDLNTDNLIDNNDLILLISYLSDHDNVPPKLANADIDGDCRIGPNDTLYLYNYLYNGGVAPDDCACAYIDSSFQFPGDVNNDGEITIDDVTFLIAFLDGIGATPPILANADPNGDCRVDNFDVQYLNEFLFSGGAIPVAYTCYSPRISAGVLPGDFNSDGEFTVADLIFFSSYLHGSGPEPFPLANADANGDCNINVGDSKLVFDHLFNGGPPPVDSTCETPVYMSPCCWNIRGNVDYDPADVVDISDLVAMVDFIFLSSSNFLCMEEVNVDGSVGEEVDISDLVALVDFIFTAGPSPAACP